MYTAPSRSRTVQALVREWWNEELLHRELGRRFRPKAPTGFPPAEDIPRGRGSWRDAVRLIDRRTELIAVPPHRLRWETDVRFDGGHTAHTTGVKDGDLWWMTNLWGEIESNEGHPERGPLTCGFEHLLDPARLIGALELELGDASSWHGRDALRLRGAPKPGVGDLALHELGWPSDEYDLLIDLERGVLLRTSARLGADEVKFQEVIAVTFDEDISDEKFRLLPAG
jgi:hypothetical protein